MAAHTGEKARETGDFVCKGCDEIVRVKKGQTIPSCDCGSTEFDERRNEPGNKSSAKGRKHAPAGEHRSTRPKKRAAAKRPRTTTARRGSSASRAKKSTTGRAKKSPSARKRATSSSKR